MNKKTAFSLTELMIVLLIASLIVAASIPVLTKKHFKMPSLLGHGVYLCYYENGQLKQLQSNGASANLNDAVTVKDCIFSPPQKASFFQISAVGGGGGGGDSGYNGGHPYSGWIPMQEFSAMGIQEADLLSKNIPYSDFRKYSGKLHVYALGRPSGVPNGVMVVNTVERCILLPEPECKPGHEKEGKFFAPDGQCIVPEGTPGATKHEVYVGVKPVKVPINKVPVYTTGSTKYTNCEPVCTCLHKKQVPATGCQCKDAVGATWGWHKNPCTYSQDSCTSSGHTGAQLEENVTKNVDSGECVSPMPSNKVSNSDWDCRIVQNSTYCKVEGTYKDRIFIKEQWDLQAQIEVYYTAPCVSGPKEYTYTYCDEWDTTNIGKNPDNPKDIENCGEIGTFYYNKGSLSWNNGTNAVWEPEDFLYDHPIKPFNSSNPKYVRNTNRFSVSPAYFCTTSKNKEGEDVRGDLNLSFKSPSFEVNPKGPYHNDSQGSHADDSNVAYSSLGYNQGNMPYHRLVEKNDGTYYYNIHNYYDGTTGENYDDVILNMIATYKVSPYQGNYGRVYCLQNEYQKGMLEAPWLDGCGIENYSSSKCASLGPNPNNPLNYSRDNTVKKYGEMLGCGQIGTSADPTNYSVNKNKWLYSDAMILKGGEIISHIKGYSAWKGQPGILRLKDKKRTLEYKEKYPGSTPFQINGIYSNAYQGKFLIEVALEGLKIDQSLFNRVKIELQNKGIIVSDISDLVNRLGGFYTWNGGNYDINEDKIYDANGDFTEQYKDYLASGKAGLGYEGNVRVTDEPEVILNEIYNQESLVKPWSGRGLCENGLRENDDSAVTKYSKTDGFYWCRLYVFLGSSNDVYYHLSDDEITNTHGYCLQHDINPNGSGYNKVGENVDAQIKNPNYYMQPNEFAKYRYRYSFDQNFLQYGNPGAAGEYKSMVVRSLKDMDTTVHIGRGGQAGNFKSGDSGTDGSATSMGTVIVAEGGKGGEGGLVSKAEVLPSYNRDQYWKEWLCKNKKDGEFSPPAQDDDMFEEYKEWRDAGGTNPNCETIETWQHVVTSGLIEGGQPALKGLAANLYNYVIPQLKDNITRKFEEFGKGGKGGGVVHSCWVGQNIVQFEYYNLSSSTCPHSGYFIDADGTRKPCAGNIDSGYHTLPCDPYDAKNYEVFGGEDGADGALMIRW